MTPAAVDSTSNAWRSSHARAAKNLLCASPQQHAVRHVLDPRRWDRPLLKADLVAHQGAKGGPRLGCHAHSHRHRRHATRLRARDASAGLRGTGAAEGSARGCHSTPACVASAPRARRATGRTVKPASWRNCGSCVVLPEPVSPMTTRRALERMSATSSARICQMGSARRCSCRRSAWTASPTSEASGGARRRFLEACSRDIRAQHARTVQAAARHPGMRGGGLADRDDRLYVE